MSSRNIQPECGKNKQADAGRDGRTRLARPDIFPGANGDREMFPFSADDEQDCWKPYPVDPYFAGSSSILTIPTYYYTLVARVVGAVLTSHTLLIVLGPLQTRFIFPRNLTDF